MVYSHFGPLPLGESIPDHDPSEDSSGLPLDFKSAYSAAHANSGYSCVYNGMLQDNDKLCESEVARHAGEVDNNNSNHIALIDAGFFWIPDSGRSPGPVPQSPPDTPDKIYVDPAQGDGGEWVFIRGNYTLPNGVVKKLTQILDPSNPDNDKCLEYLNYLITNAKNDKHLDQQYTPKDILNRLLNADYVKDDKSGTINDGPDTVIDRVGNTLILHHGYFYEKDNTPNGTSGGTTTLSSGSPKEAPARPALQASMLVGEGVHLLFTEPSDIFLANYTAAYKKSKETYKDKNEASEYFHRTLESICKEK